MWDTAPAPTLHTGAGHEVLWIFGYPVGIAGLGFFIEPAMPSGKRGADSPREGS
jgi:hypothetical protein